MDEWVGIPRGYAYYGTTYDKGAPIWFVSDKKKSLDDFVKRFFSYSQIEDEEDRQFFTQQLYEDYPEVGTVYPYDRIGGIEEKFENGTIIFVLDVPAKEKGHWTKKYIRVAPSRMKRMPDYVG